jgi:hypothetical protein
LKTKFYWGETGSGKTLRAVKDLLIDYLLGRQIISNATLKLIPYTKLDLLDLIDMAMDSSNDIFNNQIPKTMFLDEIQTAFDGRRAMTKNNIDFSLFISQCRKRGINVIYTSQFISGADPRIRTLTDKLIRCVSIKDYNDLGLSTDPQNPEPIKFKYYIVNPKDPSRVIRKSWKRGIARVFYKFYDTYEVIRPVESYV